LSLINDRLKIAIVCEGCIKIGKNNKFTPFKILLIIHNWKEQSSGHRSLLQTMSIFSREERSFTALGSKA
jgi:hypothetical protein